MTKLIIKDRPCGWGKTTEMIDELQNNQNYIIVVPLLTETERVQNGAAKRGIRFFRPGFDGNTQLRISKGDHVRELIAKKRNVVCTHELFYRLGSLATDEVAHGLRQASPISDYHVIIDEVIAPFSHFQGVNNADFKRDYVGLDLISLNSDGLVVPTKNWDDRINENNQTFSRELYLRAKSSGLYFVDGGIFIESFPLELLLKPKSVTVLTFLNQGSFFRRYLEKIIAGGAGIELEVDELAEWQQAQWRKDVLSSLRIESIPCLQSAKLSFSGQTNIKPESRRIKSGQMVANCLSNFYYRNPSIQGIPLEQIMITCARSNWFDNNSGKEPKTSFWSKNSRIFGKPKHSDNRTWTTTGAKWVANTTRGTNDYSDCSHAIYLYDQHPHPQVMSFLRSEGGENSNQDFRDAYALTELVQWLFRSQIRRGGFGRCEDGRIGYRGDRPITTVFIPSRRMKNLLENWLETGAVTSLPKHHGKHAA